MAAPKKAKEDLHVVRNISMPPGLWERTRQAAGNLPVSRWWVEAAELKLAVESGDELALAQVLDSVRRGIARYSEQVQPVPAMSVEEAAEMLESHVAGRPGKILIRDELAEVVTAQQLRDASLRRGDLVESVVLPVSPRDLERKLSTPIPKKSWRLPTADPDEETPG